MIRVNVLCEDRTGTGLGRIIESAVNQRRTSQNRARLWFRSPAGTVLNNYRLLEQCPGYERLRFNHTPRFDHVVYVIDAWRVWDLRDIEHPAPRPNEELGLYLESLTGKVVAAMEQRARGQRNDDEWAKISAGFHPHMLVWERESLMLPVSEDLGLGLAPEDSQAVRHPAKWLEQRHRAHTGRKHVKKTDGPAYLGQIARNASLCERVLTAVPSLGSLVACALAA
jgi:hypothetical protein